MFVLNGRKIDITAPYKDATGYVHSDLLDVAVRTRLGVVEVADPADAVEFNAMVDAYMDKVEDKYPRRTRELVLQLSEAVFTPAELTANAAYKKLKELDALIAALRLKRK